MSCVEVSEIEARSALIQLTPPPVCSDEIDVDPAEFQYELSLSEKQDGAYSIMYRSRHYCTPLDHRPYLRVGTVAQ